jgi:hypothetical protein
MGPPQLRPRVITSRTRPLNVLLVVLPEEKSSADADINTLSNPRIPD